MQVNCSPVQGTLTRIEWQDQNLVMTVLCVPYSLDRHHSCPVLSRSVPVVSDACMHTSGVQMCVYQACPEGGRRAWHARGLSCHHQAHPSLTSFKIHPLHPQVTDERCVVNAMAGALKTPGERCFRLDLIRKGNRVTSVWS
jgi:hypothetical protein